MSYDCKVLADSIAHGVRLTTLQVTIPRIVLAEFNTHRTFCLAGDSELEFDLPSGSRRRVYRMRLDEFVDKWTHGARRYASNPKREYDLSWIEPNSVYTAPHAAARIGIANAGSIHQLCRSGVIVASKHADGRTWMITGEALKSWRQSTPEHTRFDMRAKLSGMRIRQLNEKIGDIQWSHVTDAVMSGTKEVYEVIAGDYTVAGSLDHLVMTTDGWKRIGDINRTDQLIVRKFGKNDDDKLDPTRLKKLGGIWRAQWQREERARLQEESSLCRRCGLHDGVNIHHIEPVYRNPSRAFDATNITLLCDPCHSSMHETQDWQGGTYLYGASVSVDEVRSRGMAPTYDLSIAGEFPNFIANGVVVHNSRNSASSRAIPVEKRIAALLEDPFIPEAFQANKRGMQGGAALDEDEQDRARSRWLHAMEEAVVQARELAGLGVHKHWANRIIEPWLWHTIVCTATEWANFYALRDNEMAAPEMQTAARLMKKAMAESTPQELNEGEWHLPFIYEEDHNEKLWLVGKEEFTPAEMDLALAKISCARCARVSYLTHDGKRDVAADLALHDKLLTSGHMSPFEHAAIVGPAPVYADDFIGNFRTPWWQYRKQLPHEDVFQL